MAILEAVILWGRVQAVHKVHKGKKFDRQMSLTETSIVIAAASAA